MKYKGFDIKKVRSYSVQDDGFPVSHANADGDVTKDKARDWARHHANRLFADGGWDTCDAVEMISDNSFDAGYDFAKSESNDLREKAQALVDQVGYDQRKWVKEFFYSYQRELAALKKALK